VAQIESTVRDAVADWSIPVEVVTGPTERARAFGGATAACAVMGTITLELAAAGVPFTAIYIVDAFQKRHIVKHAVRRGSLPNIILDRDVVPEIPSVVPEPERVSRTMSKVLDAGWQQVEAFAEMRAQLTEGIAGWPRVAPEDRVLARAGR
jgi:lipid-A-disaccharide synthase